MRPQGRQWAGGPKWIVLQNRTASPPGGRRRPSRGAAGVARIAPTARFLAYAGSAGPLAAMRARAALALAVVATALPVQVQAQTQTPVQLVSTIEQSDDW